MPSALPAIALPVGLFLAFWTLCFAPLAGLVRLTRASTKRASAWVAGSRAGRWSIGHSGPIGSYAPIFLVMVVGAIAAVGAGHLFEELAEQVRLSTSAVSRADQGIHAWFGHERQPAMTGLLRAVTMLGGSAGMGALVALVMTMLLIRKERASAIFLVVTTGTGELLNLVLKMIFARTRPDLATALTVAHSFSFPSGHAMGSFICLGALSYLALRQPWSWVVKSAVLAFGLTTIVLVGLSRVYLGVHWASDIAGGWSAGVVWLAAAMVAFEMLLGLRQRRRGAAPSSASTDLPDRPVPAQPAKP
ncbi:MAG: phosphatase PAP2 family protein [Gemmatimonadales bacterium]